MKQFHSGGGAPIQTQIQMAFQKPHLHMMEEIEKILQSYPLKDLQFVMPQLLEMLFNFDGSCPDELNFGRLTFSRSYEFEVVKRFFSLDSLLMSTVLKLSTDPTCFMYYEFPFSNMPLSTQNEICKCQSSLFYSSKLKRNPLTQAIEAVVLDAFELFMVHFAFYLVNSSNWKLLHLINQQHERDWIYISIANDYFNYFFSPNNEFISPKIPVDLKTNAYHHYLHLHQQQQQQMGASQFSPPKQWGMANQPHQKDYSPPNLQHRQQQQYGYNSPNSSFMDFSPSSSSPRSNSPFYQPPFNQSSPHYVSPTSPRPQQQHQQRLRLSRLFNIDNEMLLTLSGTNYGGGGQFDSSTNTGPTTIRSTSLMQPFGNNNAFDGRSLHSTFYSDTVLQIFSDFWLNQFDDSSLEQQLRSSNKMLKGDDYFLLIRLLVKHVHWFSSSSIDTLSPTSPSSTMGPGDARSICGRGGSKVGGVGVGGLMGGRTSDQQHQQYRMSDDAKEWNTFKKNIWTSTGLADKLFKFLKHHFTYSVLDRPIIEIWLSFIQPWRYDTQQQQQQQQRPTNYLIQQQHRFDVRPQLSEQDVRKDVDKVVPDIWVPFIRRNIFMYTYFLQLSIDRFSCLDLTNYQNIFLLSRVAKVFVTRNLKEILVEVEQQMSIQRSDHINNLLPAMNRNNNNNNINKNNNINNNINNNNTMNNNNKSNIGSPFSNQIVELGIGRMDERHEYRTINSLDTETQVIRVITMAISARDHLVERLEECERMIDGKSLFQRMMSWFSISDMQMSESLYIESINLLNAVINQLTTIFQIPLSRLSTSPWHHSDSPTSQSTNSSPYLRRRPNLENPTVPVYSNRTTPRQYLGDGEQLKRLPDCEVDDDGRVYLTPLGRYEIITGKKKFDMEFGGDLDLQPIRANECAPLVKYLYRVSSFINEKHSGQLIRSVKRDGLMGYVARYLFLQKKSNFSVSTSFEPTNRSTNARNYNVFTSHQNTSQSETSALNSSIFLTNRNQSSNPRISLRFLASYSNMLLFVVLSLLLKWILGVDFVLAVVLLLILIGLFCVFVFKYLLGADDDCGSNDNNGESYDGGESVGGNVST